MLLPLKRFAAHPSVVVQSQASGQNSRNPVTCCATSNDSERPRNSPLLSSYPMTKLHYEREGQTEACRHLPERLRSETIADHARSTMSLRLSGSQHALRLCSSTNAVCAPLLRAPVALRAADVPSFARASSSSSSPATSNPATSPAQPSNEAPASSSTLLSGFAKLLGYNHNSATAIRSTNYYYDMLCNRHTKNENEFWFEGSLSLPCCRRCI